MMLGTFWTDESGAITVDWVVLTAGMVGLGLGTMGVVSGGADDLTTDMDNQMQIEHIIVSFGTDFGAFDFSAYQRMDPVHHAGNWTHLMGVIGGMNQAQLDTQLAQALTHAATGATPEIQAWGVDVYAATYNQMVQNGEDVSGMTHPQELINTWQAEHGTT